MRTYMTLGIVVLLAVVGSGTAEAARLYTAPITPQTDEGIRCIILNVGKKARRMAATVIDPFGVAPQPNFLTVQPGAVIASTTSVGAQINGYCQFTFEGSKRDVRAAGCAADGLLRCTTAMVEAR